MLICSLTLPQSFEPAVGEEPQFAAEQVRFFESRVRPLLIQHCLECHAGAEAESGLRLDSREAILTGGDSGESGPRP